MRSHQKQPPALAFPNPPCSLCSCATVELHGRFRCHNCRCSWDADTAHLFVGEWDADIVTIEEVA